ncbi:hypothetical protein [Paenisporosarcina antarctica]|uniref:hypothetical protein n=1 Tax=Paenisporosarcina antarctica TaxID=417367 RepID=UPI0014170443|nr:hypothetical protein [Paenisporosarcina antarctica]
MATPAEKARAEDPTGNELFTIHLRRVTAGARVFRDEEAEVVPAESNGILEKLHKKSLP